MAGAGYKLFNTGDVLTAAQVNTYLQEQVVMVFANAAARTTALSGVLAEGMVSYLKDTNATEVYDGSAWVGIGNSGDITGVTAGTGISGGGTSGTVTITNDMATTITASGDIVVGTGSGTYDNLPIGSTGQVLTADTTVSPYKVKWAAASSGASWSLVASGSLSGNSLSLTSLSGKAFYVGLFLWSHDDTSSTRHPFMRFNNDTGNNYYTPFNGGPFAQIEPFGSDSRVNTDTRSNGVFIDMADTAMTYKPTYSINGNAQATSAGGWWGSTSAINRIDIYLTATKNFDAGTYACWKLA